MILPGDELTVKTGSGTRSITHAIRTAIGTILHTRRRAYHFGRDEGEVWVKIAPRRLIYVPPKMAVEIPGEDQERVVLPSSVPNELDEQAEEDSESAMRLLKSKRKRSPAHSKEHQKYASSSTFDGA